MPYSKSRQIHYDESVKRYFNKLEREGHDLSEWMYLLRSPGGVPPVTMIRFAEHIGADIGDLLSNGIGRNNAYDAIDNAARKHYGGMHLGLVELIED